jgi:hypothetical protein
MEKSYLKLLASKGYSIIPCKPDKSPDGAWKSNQTKARTVEEVDALNCELYGLVTGYNNLEVIDIDCKVITDFHEQKAFWSEFIAFLSDNIEDFYKKFVIKKTKNKGYHILYRCEKTQGNTKIAKLKGASEALIESRGIGGMVIAYDDTLGQLNYQDIQTISVEDRDILWSCCAVYNYIEPEADTVAPAPAKVVTEFSESQIKPWDDFNQKNTVWDLISSEFTIPSNGNKSKHILVKRHGATSPHSGYIFKDSGCLYLFSTGTIYPHEKLLTPFHIYSYQVHNGDFSASAKELYQLGYGSRAKKLVQRQAESLPDNTELIENYLYNKEDLIFPIDIFPKPIQSYILECNEKLDSNIDYMGCSLLWLISVCIGNAIEIEVKRGWTENPTIWMSLVGKAGIGKTPSINNIIFPLLKINSREIKKYFKELEKWEYYNNLTKKEQAESIEVDKPIKTQFIANDITLEALVDLHQESDNAVGVFKDELAGWLKDMNKYRAGSDLEFWLSCWSGKSVNLNRLTRKGSFVEKPFIPVLGGIQPNILNSFYTEENKDNGFMDRMLLSFPESRVELYNENELEYDVLNWYKETIVMFYDVLKTIIKRDEEGGITPLVAKFSDEAKEEWKRIFNEISNHQNSEEENEYLKSMYPKQKSYIPRFCLLIHAFNEFFESANGNTLLISKESVLKAEKLSKYFIATAKKVKVNSIEVTNIKSTAKGGKSNFDKLKLIYEENPDFNRSQVADLLGISRTQVKRLLQKITGT